MTRQTEQWSTLTSVRVLASIAEPVDWMGEEVDELTSDVDAAAEVACDAVAEHLRRCFPALRFEVVVEGP